MNKHVKAHNNALRYNDLDKVRFVQQNCNKSVTVNKEIRDLISRKRFKRFVFFGQEPGLARRYGVGPTIPCSLPLSKNVFYKASSRDFETRSYIVADESQEIDMLPQFTSADVVSALWRVCLKDTKPTHQGKSSELGPTKDKYRDVDARPPTPATTPSRETQIRANASKPPRQATASPSHAGESSTAGGTPLRSRLNQYHTVHTPGPPTSSPASKTSGTKVGDHISLRKRRIPRRMSSTRESTVYTEGSLRTSDEQIESELLDSLFDEHSEDLTAEVLNATLGSRGPTNTTSPSKVIIICSLFWASQ